MTSIQLDTERAATGAPAPDKSGARDEKARFHAILSQMVEKRDGGLFASIPRPGRAPLTCPLPRKSRDDPVRAWALSSYIEQYGQNGKIANYAAALADTWLNLGEPAQDRGADLAQDTQGEQEKRGRGRPKSKLSADDETALFVIDAFKDWEEDGPYPGSKFARVPVIKDTRGYELGAPAQLSRRYTGLWYLPGQDKPPTRLIDAALYYQDVTYPHASAKNKPHTGMLRAVNGRGQEKLFPFTGNELRDRENNKFKSFAKWPQDVPTQARLLNAMEALFTSDPATIWHEQVDDLGYTETEKQGLVYPLANGIETARGFISNEKAPVVGPDLISPGNGYQGTDKKYPPSDDVYRLIFEDLNEEDAIRIAAKMGAMMYTWFPPGTVEQAGRLPFYMETIGAPSCGKTPEDNIVKSHEGIGFRYNSPPFMTNDDTKPSAPAKMQAMKYHIFSDDDRKCSPGAPGFQGEHASRRRHINYFADGQGAGSRYYDHATRIASRGEPQGAPMGTGNYDHAIYALSTPGLDEDAVELRACTFVVSSGAIRTEQNSRGIFARKEEIYAMGRAARAWLMHEYNRDRAGLRDYLQDLGARAGVEMHAAFPYDWEETKQKEHCRMLVWGVLAWLDFLAKYGPGREQGYLYQKLTYLLSGIVEDRAIRSNYLHEMIRQRDGGADLSEFVLEAIRQTLAQARGHIIHQTGEPLAPDDIPPEYSLNVLGYFTRPVLGGATTDDPDYIWDHGHTVLGHYMKRSRAIAFRMDALYSVALAPHARETKYILPRPNEIKKRLIDAGILTEAVNKIKGRNERILVISLDVLDLPGRAMVDEEEEEEKRELMAEVDKVVSLEQARADRAGSPAPVARDLGEIAIPDRAGGATAQVGTLTVLTSENEDPFSFDPYA